MMTLIHNEFNDRVDEINIYFQHLENIIEKEARLMFGGEAEMLKIENFDLKLGLTLKSSAILLLYNLVESTVSKCLNTVHQAIHDENCHFFDLSDEIQTIWLKHHYKTIQESSEVNDKMIGDLKGMLAILSKHKTIDISPKASKQLLENQFSGNLDAKEIRRIAKSYGIDFKEESKEIRTIEQKRNQLAHGELSFEEGCRDFSMIYMRVLRDRTIVFMRTFIEAVEQFISDKKFKT